MVKGTDLFFGSGKIEKTVEFFHLNKSVPIFTGPSSVEKGESRMRVGLLRPQLLGSTGRTDSTETWSNNTRLSFDTYLLIDASDCWT